MQILFKFMQAAGVAVVVMASATMAAEARSGCTAVWDRIDLTLPHREPTIADFDAIRADTGRRVQPRDHHRAMCGLIETAAKAHGVLPDFLARLIWQESRFNVKAVSPKGAQGIAQFMPATAAERGLDDPFEPSSALVHSAGFLKELACEFGNFGLAAAAYNAGPQRVRNWLAGAGGLPLETEDYVRIITGREADGWIGVKEDPDAKLAEGKTFAEGCAQLAALAAKRKDAPDAAPWRPWGVWVAADFSRNKALSHYANLRKRYGKAMPADRPMVVRVVDYSRGRRALHSIRIGADSRKAANGICAKLKAAGGACLVMKN